MLIFSNKMKILKVILGVRGRLLGSKCEYVKLLKRKGEVQYAKSLC